MCVHLNIAGDYGLLPIGQQFDLQYKVADHGVRPFKVRIEGRNSAKRTILCYLFPLTAMLA